MGMAKVARSSKVARGSKPGERRGGRRKGTPNKMSRDLREMILGALNDAGGQAYLVRQALENPSAFLPLVKGCLPKQIAADITTQVEAQDRRAIIEDIVRMLGDGSSNRRQESPMPALAAPGGLQEDKRTRWGCK